jgi:hypothetical protein
MGPGAKAGRNMEMSAKIADASKELSPGGPSSGSGCRLLDSWSQRLALAESDCAIQDSGSEASATGIGDIGEGDGIEGETA